MATQHDEARTCSMKLDQDVAEVTLARFAARSCRARSSDGTVAVLNDHFVEHEAQPRPHDNRVGLQLPGEGLAGMILLLVDGIPTGTAPVLAA